MPRPQARAAGAVLLALAALTLAPRADAAVYLTGSIAASTSNVPYQTYQSSYGSASLSFDVGPYLRLGYTYSQEYSIEDGYTEAADAAQANDGKIAPDEAVHSLSRSIVTAHSIDLTIILYEGQVFMPYLMAGVIKKLYRFESQTGDADPVVNEGTMPFLPNLGAGVGLRLNQNFMLKLSFLASPGVVQRPEDSEPKSAWDRKLTVGLTYQI
jgi:hypothetical protein